MPYEPIFCIRSWCVKRGQNIATSAKMKQDQTVTTDTCWVSNVFNSIVLIRCDEVRLRGPSQTHTHPLQLLRTAMLTSHLCEWMEEPKKGIRFSWLSYRMRTEISLLRWVSTFTAGRERHSLTRAFIYLYSYIEVPRVQGKCVGFISLRIGTIAGLF
jgi:hypothetical protein